MTLREELTETQAELRRQTERYERVRKRAERARSLAETGLWYATRASGLLSSAGYLGDIVELLKKENLE